MSLIENLEADRAFPAGQRLHCEACNAEIEIIQPCTCSPPDQVLSCCGKLMTASTGQKVNLGVE